MKKIELNAGTDDQNERLDRFISRRGGISRSEARRLLDRGAVWVDGHRVKISSRGVQSGQQVLVVFEESGRAGFEKKTLRSEQILYEDQAVIVVDKSPGVPSQATLGGDRGTLPEMVSSYLGRPVGLVHRLDLETSGVVIFGKTRAATAGMCASFRGSEPKKKYLALVGGELADQGTIELPLRPDPQRRGRFIACHGCSLPAQTSFRVIGRHAGICAVELYPKTGRTHQLRAHLASQGTPILGDALYGGRPEWITSRGLQKAWRVLLHAHSLQIIHPVTQELLSLTAPIPRDMTEWLELCGLVA